MSRSLSQSGWEASLRWLPLPLFLFCFFLIWLQLSSLLCRLLWLWQAGDTPHGIVRSRSCDGFSCGAQTLGCAWASVVAAHGLRSCGSRLVVRERDLGSCRWLTGSVTLQHVESFQSRTNPCSLHWQADLSTLPPGCPLPFLMSSLNRVWLSYHLQALQLKPTIVRFIKLTHRDPHNNPCQTAHFQCRGVGSTLIRGTKISQAM